MSFAPGTWQDYVNDVDGVRNSIDSTVFGFLGSDDRPSNFDSVFSVWTKFHEHVNRGIENSALVFALGKVGQVVFKSSARNALTTTINKRWSVGDDVYNLTAKGNAPSWTTVRTRFWKNEASNSGASKKYGANNLERMRKGRAPQRYNADKGGNESMELSHEPIPFRDGGREFVPRWPQDHARVDPFRHPGY